MVREKKKANAKVKGRKAAKSDLTCKHEYCKQYRKIVYSNRQSRSRHVCNMKLHEHKLCMEHFNECSACEKLEKRGVFTRSQKTSNSNMDASLDEPTRQDDDIDDIEDQQEPLDMGRTCPVCNKILRSSNTYHLKVCAQKALGVIEDEHRNLGHDEHMDLFNIIATGSRLVYNNAGLDWCKGNCGRLISIDQQQHQLCGWNRRAPFEGAQQQSPPKDADRPSDFIEERIPIVHRV